MRRLKLGILALNLMVLTLLTLTLYDNRQHLIAEANITANNLTGLLATNMESVFDKVDQSLLTVVDKLNDDGALNPSNRAELQAFMARQAERLVEVDRIGISDAQGNLSLQRRRDRPCGREHWGPRLFSDATRPPWRSTGVQRAADQPRDE